MPLFLLVIFAVLFAADAGAWAVLDALLRHLGAGGEWRAVLGIFVAVQVAGLAVLIGARAFGHQPGTGLGKPLLALVMVWNCLLSLPTAVLGAVAFIAWMGMGGGLPGETGRTLAIAAVFVAPGLALVGAAVSVWQLDRFRVARVALRFPNLPPALHGFTIAHLSDLHVGLLTRGPVLAAMTAATNRLRPDLIAVTGDLVNMALSDLPDALAVLRGMEARHGIFLCEGNHDLIESRTGFEEGARASGLRFLFDESARIEVGGEPVRLLGLRWGHEGGEAAARLLAERQPGEFAILLAHHPDAFDAAAAAGVPLTLSGHTHGGQLMLTRRLGFGPRLYRYWSGLYRKGACWLVVSNGTGNWFPLRIGAPAEIVLLTLQPEED